MKDFEGIRSGDRAVVVMCGSRLVALVWPKSGHQSLVCKNGEALALVEGGVARLDCKCGRSHRLSVHNIAAITPRHAQPTAVRVRVDDVEASPDEPLSARQQNILAAIRKANDTLREVRAENDLRP